MGAGPCDARSHWQASKTKTGSFDINPFSMGLSSARTNNPLDLPASRAPDGFYMSSRGRCPELPYQEKGKGLSTAFELKGQRSKLWTVGDCPRLTEEELFRPVVLNWSGLGSHVFPMVIKSPPTSVKLELFHFSEMGHHDFFVLNQQIFSYLHSKHITLAK